MADTFEEVAQYKGQTITFHPKDGHTVTGKIEEVDEAARTIKLKDGRVVEFPKPEETKP